VQKAPTKQMHKICDKLLYLFYSCNNCSHHCGNWKK